MRKQTKFWTMKTGEKIRICDMEDSHLLNTIKMLERNTKTHTQQTINLGYSMLNSLHGEQAILSVEQDMNALEEYGEEPHEIYPIYENLYQEAIRRKILGGYDDKEK